MGDKNNFFDTTATLVWPVSTRDPEALDQRVEDPHVTIVFLGQTENLPSAEEIVKILTGKVRSIPLPLEIEDLAVFGDVKKYDVALLKKKAILLDLRERMVATLAEAGVKDASTWPDYSPHVTLGPEGSDRWIAGTVHLERPVLWYNNVTHEIP